MQNQENDDKGVQEDFEERLSSQEGGEEMDDEESPQENNGKETKIVQRTTGKESKPGIIYLSRIPPLMRPNRIKQIFLEYGEVARVFLQPEDDFFRKKRKKKGGSRSKNFTEGWVEFKRKKIAKRVALTLNNSQVSNKKRSQYFDELWNIKYLPGFKWQHLVERLEYERQVKQQRTRTEISQAKKETSIYLQNVEKGRRLEKIAAKRQRQGREFIHREKRYRQRRTRDEIVTSENVAPRSGKVKKDTLMKIFKKS